ncbi:MAG: sugar ABC transporter permease [Acholeplasmataceae bacterium]|nr:sugar ABC transporter permease [Acholeplasmataceae bacterium]
MAKKEQTYRSFILKQKIVPYLFLGPNLLIFSIFIILPALIGIYYSFTDMTLFTFSVSDANFIGLDNYRALLQDQDFIAALWNTIKLVVVTVPIMFVTSLLVAVLLVQPLKAKGFFRAVYYWPVMISAVVVGIIWQWILAGNFGLFNTIIKSLGFDPIETLINPRFAWWSVVFAIVWSRTGYYMIVFVAALLSIPESLYEAAEMDGANKLQKFRHITYPSLRAARLMVFILVTMEIFKIYPLVVTLTGGGPFDSTQFTVQYIYEMAFKKYQVGLASSMSVVMLLIVTIFTALNFFLSKRGENK